MINLENALYSREQIRTCEQMARSLYHLDEHALMSRAGSEALALLMKLYPQVRHIAVFCGAGNNAGDGYVLARLAHEQGLWVKIYQSKEITELPFAAQHAAVLALAAGVYGYSVEEPLDPKTELIVDALLGIGLAGPVYGRMVSVIERINSSGLAVVALDIPSGLNANTGKASSSCIKANTSLTFIAPKAGMYTADGPDFCGSIHCCSLQLDTCISSLPPKASLLNPSAVALPLNARKKNTHKGDYGHVLVIGGASGMPGSVSLVAKAAMRSGAGAVSIATWPEHAKAALALIPEAMIWGVQTVKELFPLLDKASVCVIGPGLGDSQWALSLFLATIRSQLPMVIDASALRLLADNSQRRDHWILTPHPGEAGCLLSCTGDLVQNDRYEAAAEIQQRYGGLVVLKGAGSIIQTREKNTFVCPRGNPAMASAGMGDVLSGIIAGLCAQGFSLSNAAQTGVWAHASAADQMAQSLGGPGLLASDLFDVLPHVLNRCE